MKFRKCCSCTDFLNLPKHMVIVNKKDTRNMVVDLMILKWLFQLDAHST